MRYLLLLVVACGNKSTGPSNTPPPPKPPGTVDTCAADADCTLVSESCCSCSAGGKNVAILKSTQAIYEAEHTKSCEGTMCPQVISNDPSCHAAAACEAGHCIAKPKPGGAGGDVPPM